MSIQFLSKKLSIILCLGFLLMIVTPKMTYSQNVTANSYTYGYIATNNTYYQDRYYNYQPINKIKSNENIVDNSKIDQLHYYY